MFLPSHAQYSICGKTRGVISNVFLTKPVNENLRGWEAPEKGLSPPRQIWSCRSPVLVTLKFTSIRVTNTGLRHDQICGSRLAARGSRLAARGSRLAARGSRLAARGSRLNSQRCFTCKSPRPPSLFFISSQLKFSQKLHLVLLKMSAAVELTYFDGRGLAEIIRLVLTAGEIKVYSAYIMVLVHCWLMVICGLQKYSWLLQCGNHNNLYRAPLMTCASLILVTYRLLAYLLPLALHILQNIIKRCVNICPTKCKCKFWKIVW